MAATRSPERTGTAAADNTVLNSGTDTHGGGVPRPRQLLRRHSRTVRGKAGTLQAEGKLHCERAEAVKVSRRDIRRR